MELDETTYWFELLADSETVKPVLLAPLQDEANQLLAMLTASVRTAKRNRDK